MAKKKAAARPAARYRFEDATKFLWMSNIPGTSQTTSRSCPVYETAVNIHNPQRRTVELRTKLAVASGEISKFIDGKLEPMPRPGSTAAASPITSCI